MAAAVVMAAAMTAADLVEAQRSRERAPILNTVPPILRGTKTWCGMGVGQGDRAGW